MNQVKLSCKVFRSTKLKNCTSLRVMFRNGINQARFIDVMTQQDIDLDKDDQIEVEGTLSVMEKDNDKYKFDRTFIWAEKVTKTGKTDKEVTKSDSTPVETKEEKPRKTRTKRVEEVETTERVPF